MMSSFSPNLEQIHLPSSRFGDNTDAIKIDHASDHGRPHAPIRQTCSRSSLAPITRSFVRLCGSCTAISGASSVSLYSSPTPSRYTADKNRSLRLFCFQNDSTYTSAVHDQMRLTGLYARQSLASLLSPTCPWCLVSSSLLSP